MAYLELVGYEYKPEGKADKAGKKDAGPKDEKKEAAPKAEAKKAAGEEGAARRRAAEDEGPSERPRGARSFAGRLGATAARVAWRRAAAGARAGCVAAALGPGARPRVLAGVGRRPCPCPARR